MCGIVDSQVRRILYRSGGNDVNTEDPKVLVEFPEVWFEQFEDWLSHVRICDVPTNQVIAVHRCYECILESRKEFYHEQ